MNNYIKKRYSVAAFTLAFVLAVSALGLTPVLPAAAVTSADAAEVADDSGYMKYISGFKDALYPETPIILTANEAVSEHDVQQTSVEGKNAVLSEENTLTWKVNAAEAGLYALYITYFPVKGKSSTIERSLNINGSIPFTNAGHFTFYSNYINDGLSEETGFERDSRGNDIRPSQVESPVWTTSVFSDYLGMYNQPYYFYLEGGENTVSLSTNFGSIYVEQLVFKQPEKILSYSELSKEYEKNGYKPASSEEIEISGEWASAKSDPMLYPTQDRSSYMTEPSSPTKIRLNIIGGSNWNSVGQSCSWKVSVEESGLYALTIKYRQNLARGIWTNRTLRVDGNVPFAEAESIRFQYGGWSKLTLSDKNGDTCYIYLEKGTHELSLTATVGELSSVLEKASASVSSLNKAYRELLMILGSTPDYYRDYQLDKQVPDALDEIKTQAEELEEISAQLFKITGRRGTLTSVIDRLSVLLGTLSDNPKLIQRRWSDLKSSISSFADWILDVKEQPLEIDYMVLSGEAVKTAVTGNVFRNIWFEICSLAGSFTEDYDSIGDLSDSGHSITVWVQAGRDQAQLLKNMVINDFSAKSGIPVNIQLVQGVLLQAIISGRAPDVCLNLGSAEPMNLALRGAVVDISKFDGYDKIAERFYQSALTPFTFNGAVYALPETQTFPMMFYREDVLAEFGITPPSTWDELIRIFPIVQRKNLDVGVESSMFTTVLYQFGGELYNDDGSQCIIDSETGINAFTFFTQLYLDYQLPQSYNFVNRFRTGEMPLGIADYSTFNTLSVFAPEIRGLWKMIPIIGMKDTKTGEINRTVASTVTGCIMLSSCAQENRENAFSFMDWWTSAEVQKLYGKEMESLLGVAARYTSANIQAVAESNWTAEDKQNLFAQWEDTKGVPEIPGSYFTSRHINNAFRQVVYRSEDPRDILSEYVVMINEEIKSKRKEFGLSTD